MSEVTALNPAGVINDFVDVLYGDESGYVYSPKKNSETGEFLQSFYEWPTERGRLISELLGYSGEYEVYLAPALFDAPSATKDHFKLSRVLWTEFDGNTPSHFKDVPQPSIRIQSSDLTHQHCYWVLDEAISKHKELEAYNRRIAYTLSADASSWDCNQVLRPPATFNHKRQTQVSVLSKDATPLSVALFTPSYPTVEVQEIDASVIPDVTDVIYKHAFTQEAASLFKTRELPVGERSTALMRLGFSLAEMGLSDPEIYSLVRNADDRWGKFKDRYDRHQRLIDLITRAREKYPAADYQEDVIPAYGFQSFLDHEVHIEWVIPDLLQAKGYMLMTGPSGVGKTQFSLRVAIALALGRDWLGFKVTSPQRILFFSLEMGHPDLKYFVSLMAAGMSEADRAMLEQNLILIPYGEPIYLDKTEGREQFTSIIESLEPNGIFVDSLGSTTSGGISDENTVKSIMDFNDKIRKKYNIFTWFIHHHRKAQADNKKPNKMSDVYGNQYIVNRATSVYCLWPTGHGIQVIPLKKRLAGLEDPWMITRIGGLDFEKTIVAFSAKADSHVMVSESQAATLDSIKDI